jgi:hypothetical protein
MKVSLIASLSFAVAGVPVIGEIRNVTNPGGIGLGLSG